MSERLSFCMVTTFYPPYHSGGEAMYIYCLSNELARRGHRDDPSHVEGSDRCSKMECSRSMSCLHLLAYR